MKFSLIIYAVITLEKLGIILYNIEILERISRIKKIIIDVKNYRFAQKKCAIHLRNSCQS
jgi:hypothetical protein